LTATVVAMKFGLPRALFAVVSVSVGGPRLGDIESGVVAGAVGARFSVFSGGILCVAGAIAIVFGFPALMRYDSYDRPPRAGDPVVRGHRRYTPPSI
jgi:hypothetical protein